MCLDYKIRLPIGEDERKQTENVTSAASVHAANLAESDYTCITPEYHVAPPTVSNAVALPQWAIIEGAARLYAVYRCRWHHVLHGANTNVYCKQGQWIGTLPQCLPLGQ